VSDETSAAASDEAKKGETMSLFCERCKTYHEPGGWNKCAPPYPSGDEKLIRECTAAIIDAIGLHARYVVAHLSEHVLGKEAIMEDIREDFEAIEKRVLVR
jgi:hypothetical protein